MDNTSTLENLCFWLAICSRENPNKIGIMEKRDIHQQSCVFVLNEIETEGHCL